MKEVYGVQNTAFLMHVKRLLNYENYKDTFLYSIFLGQKDYNRILTIIILFIFADIDQAIKVNNVAKKTKQHQVKLLNRFVET